MKQEQFNQENQQIEQLLGAFLRSKTSETFAAPGAHLDEDSVSSFVDGSLSNRESEPIMRHLIGCSPCRKVTAQIARLAEELGEQSETMSAATEEPNRLRQFLHSLGLTGFGLADESVFAHHDSSKEDKREEEESQNTETADEQESNK